MVQIKEKHLDRREWYKDTDRDFKCIYHKDDTFEGGIGLITFTGLEVPDEVDTEYGTLRISDKGYQWIELAPKNENYVITTMLREGKIFQHYVDISLKNDMKDNGDTVFYDLFLDVVVYKGPSPSIIDEDELEEALASKLITVQEYELAKKTAKKVAEFFSDNKDSFEQKIYEYLKLF